MGSPRISQKSFWESFSPSRGYQNRHCDLRICLSEHNDPQEPYGHTFLSRLEHPGNCGGSLSPLLTLWCHGALVKNVHQEASTNTLNSSYKNSSKFCRSKISLNDSSSNNSSSSASGSVEATFVHGGGVDENLNC